jgi:hypothetical protein
MEGSKTLRLEWGGRGSPGSCLPGLGSWVRARPTPMAVSRNSSLLSAVSRNLRAVVTCRATAAGAVTRAPSHCTSDKLKTALACSCLRQGPVLPRLGRLPQHGEKPALSDSERRRAQSDSERTRAVRFGATPRAFGLSPKDAARAFTLSRNTVMILQHSCLSTHSSICDPCTQDAHRPLFTCSA